jgi:hypothetical protein
MEVSWLLDRGSDWHYDGFMGQSTDNDVDLTFRITCVNH